MTHRRRSPFPRGPRRDGDDAGPHRARIAPGPARARRRPARRAHPLPAGHLDGGQRVGAGAGRGPVRHQGQRRLLRRADLGGRDRMRPAGPGRRRVKAPSSDTDAHAYVYRNMPEVNGQVHTHSPYASAWAARGEEIPCVLTAMADEFGGPIPVGPFALIGDDSIGQGIVATLQGHRSPAVLMQNHGVFTIGPSAKAAVKAAVMTEDVARTVHLSRQLGEPIPIAQADVDSLYARYQNVYGQR